MTLINNSLYRVKEIPKYHPVADRYERSQFWKEQLKYSVEGKWVAGQWMPPELYYYINFHNIVYESAGGTAQSIGLPWLRDIDWDMFLNYTEACGFSGFEKDDRYTCHRVVLSDLSKEQIIDYYCRDENRQIIQKHYDNIFRKDGEFKEYIESSNYLRKIHWVDLGRPLYLNDAKNILLLAARGCGKEQPHTEVVMTPDGGSTMGKIKVGDLVLGKDGTPTTVTQKTYQGKKDIYELVLQDGRTVKCGLDHLWEVYLFGKQKIYTTKELLEEGLYYVHTKNGNHSYKFKIDNNYPIEYTAKELPIDPYILGALLGNGTMTTITPKIASSDTFLIEEFRRILGNDYELKYDISTSNNHTIVYLPKHNTNLLHNTLVNLGVNKRCKEKFIPEIYKYGSVEQRLSLLQGLLDTDGSINKHGSIEFTNTNYTLIQDFIDIARSLGIQCRFGVNDRSGSCSYIKGKIIERHKYYRVYLRTDLPVFRLPRKIIKVKPMSRRNWVSIIDIRKLNYKEDCSCIYVDNKDHTYLTKDYVVTHNSFCVSGLILHNFLFSGARNYEEFIKKRTEGKPFVAQSVVGSIDSKYSNDLLKKVRVALENLPGKEIIINNFGETEEYPAPFYIETTGSLMPGKNLISSTNSQISHRTFKDDPLAANGTRPNRVFLEEVGFHENILETWGALEATQAAAEHKRLVILGIGTGGLTTAGAALYTQTIFNHPEDYNCLAFEDIWENKGKIGYFIPAHLSRNKFKKGENLITDLKEAEVEIEKEIEEAKKSGNTTRLLTKIINNPRKPSEIFLRQEGVFFPVRELTEILSDLETNKVKINAIQKIELYEGKPGEVKWKYSDKPEIVDYPLSRQYEMDAAVCIYEMPRKNPDGFVYPNRYILSTDTVDDDGNDDINRSLQSTLVLDTWTDRIVAEYTARTYLASDYYEQVRLLTLFYGGRNLYENNKKGLHAYFKVKNGLYLLAETPEILKAQDYAKSSTTGNRALGVNINNQAIKLLGIDLGLKWLTLPAYDNPELKNMHTLRGRAFIQEMIKYSLDVNADRVSAFIVLMIYREELADRVRVDNSKKIKLVSEDAFWGRAYKDFNQRKVYNQIKNNRINFDTN